MAEQDKEQELEELLDSMLREYSAVDPRPGLETRILANIREASAKHRPWFVVTAWTWGGVAVTVAVLVALALYLARPVVRPGPSQVEATQKDPVQHDAAGDGPEVQTALPQMTMRHHARRHGVPQVADNRPDVFPTPAPLSEQEKLLVRYLTGTPREELIAQSHPDEPPQDALPDDQSGLPETTFSHQQSSNSQ